MTSTRTSSDSCSLLLTGSGVVLAFKPLRSLGAYGRTSFMMPSADKLRSPAAQDPGRRCSDGTCEGETADAEIHTTCTPGPRLTFGEASSSSTRPLSSLRTIFSALRGVFHEPRLGSSRPKASLFSWYIRFSDHPALHGSAMAVLPSPLRVGDQLERSGCEPHAMNRPDCMKACYIKLSSQVLSFTRVLAPPSMSPSALSERDYHIPAYHGLSASCFVITLDQHCA